MKAERDIAVITLPFAAGLAASVCIYASTARDLPIIPLISMYISLIATLILLHPGREKWHPRLQWAIIATAFLCIGVLTGSGRELLPPAESMECTGLRSIAFGFGKAMTDAIGRIPFEDSSTNSIINALITGERSGIPGDVVTAFRKSGASHILALSGLHLGIIYGILRLVMSPLGNTPSVKIVKSVAVTLFCGFYATATGCGPSIMRAFLFILLGEAAAVAGRKTSLTGILMTAFLIQTVLDPSSIKEVGFLLSYAAVAGIAFIYPVLRDFWPKPATAERILPKCMRRIWNSASMSIACQITTGPIAYAFFGTFPTYFILTNLIALPLTGLIIPAALLTLAASELGACPGILLKSTETLVRVLSDALEIISMM